MSESNGILSSAESFKQAAQLFEPGIRISHDNVESCLETLSRDVLSCFSLLIVTLDLRNPNFPAILDKHDMLLQRCSKLSHLHLTLGLPETVVAKDTLERLGNVLKRSATSRTTLVIPHSFSEDDGSEDEDVTDDPSDDDSNSGEEDENSEDTEGEETEQQPADIFTVLKENLALVRNTFPPFSREILGFGISRRI